jgi:hypothetical protein
MNRLTRDIMCEDRMMFVCEDRATPLFQSIGAEAEAKV